jgi:hypothetical protein
MSLLISLLIFAVVLIVVLYIIDLLPLPGNLNMIAKLIVGLVGLIYLLQTVGGFIH